MEIKYFELKKLSKRSNLNSSILFSYSLIMFTRSSDFSRTVAGVVVRVNFYDAGKFKKSLLRYTFICVSLSFNIQNGVTELGVNPIIFVKLLSEAKLNGWIRNKPWMYFF